MGIFSGITDAFNYVSDAITDAYDSFSESIHDVFYPPKEYVGGGGVIVTPTKQTEYEEWLIEQKGLDFGFISDYTDVFKYY